MYNRNAIINIIKPWAEANRELIAAWEGGSAATGRLDEYSDLDLSIIVEDDGVEKLFLALDDFLQAKFGITRKYRLPEPTWHGASQCFYQIEQATPFVYLDIAVFTRSNPHKLMETDRHGQAVIWFDRDHIYDGTVSSPASVIERGQKMFASLIQTDFLMIIEIEKGLARGQFVDVFPGYIGFVQRHLGVMLNLKHRPAKADFGIRYGRLEYGQQDALLLEAALKASTIGELRHRFPVIKKRYLELVNELAPIWK